MGRGDLRIRPADSARSHFRPTWLVFKPSHNFSVSRRKSNVYTRQQRVNKNNLSRVSLVRFIILHSVTIFCTQAMHSFLKPTQTFFYYQRKWGRHDRQHQITRRSASCGGDGGSCDRLKSRQVSYVRWRHRRKSPDDFSTHSDCAK